MSSRFLSGKYNKETEFPETDVRAVWQTPQERRHMIEQVQSNAQAADLLNVADDHPLAVE